jgi:hypothetical protein
MKATIIAIAITFAASGFVSSDAEARSRSRSRSNATNQRRPARTVRTPSRTVRRPVRNVRKPVRRVRRPVWNVRKPVRRVRKPVRRVRRPVRRVRRPVRHFPTLVRRHYQPVYIPAVNTITLANDHGYAIQVEIRTGNSALCSANPSQGSFSLNAGGSATVTTPAAYVCYRRLPTHCTAGTGWFRALVNARYMNLRF